MLLPTHFISEITIWIVEGMEESSADILGNILH